MTKMAVLLLALAVSVPFARAQTASAKKTAPQKKAGPTAAEIAALEKKAAAGDAKSQLALGKIYEERRTPADLQKAAEWYRKAADQNVAEAQVQLGMMYFDGRGVAKDHNEAARLFQKACDQGDADGQLALGNLYYLGEGVPKDDAKAKDLIRRSAKQGNEMARQMLMVLFKEKVN